MEVGVVVVEEEGAVWKGNGYGGVSGGGGGGSVGVRGDGGCGSGGWRGGL